MRKAILRLGLTAAVVCAFTAAVFPDTARRLLEIGFVVCLAVVPFILLFRWFLKTQEIAESVARGLKPTGKDFRSRDLDYEELKRRQQNDDEVGELAGALSTLAGFLLLFLLLLWTAVSLVRWLWNHPLF